MAAVGSLRAQQERPRSQALRQRARARRQARAAGCARRLHPPPGRREHLGRRGRQHRRLGSGRQARAVRSGRGQDLPAPDLLPAARRSEPHVRAPENDHYPRPH
uniref:PaaB n=1 Tax=Aromatoleum evansii TaxID=59406 RepID=Q9F9U8_AROEV|nr:PaaB [Aromatoleum evansii]